MINPLLCGPPQPASAVYATLHFLVRWLFFPTACRDKGGDSFQADIFIYTWEKELDKDPQKTWFEARLAQSSRAAVAGHVLRLVCLYGLFVYIHVSGLVFQGEGEGQGR